MARMPRFFLPHTSIHVIVRGNNRSSIVADDADRAFLRSSLHHAAARRGVAIHAYVLMTNHFHLLVTPQMKGSLAQMMQTVGRTYVHYFNAKYARTGTLWEGRYKATIVDEDRYFLLCMRYIELNPVRAFMVVDPAEYRWSSYRANALGGFDALVIPHAMYLALGEGTRQRCAAYRNEVGTSIVRADLETIRDATQNGWALGGSAFRDRVDALSRRSTRLPLGRPVRDPFEQEVESDPTY